jgi:hypothetical protein
VRATDPHKPLDYERLAQSPTTTRVFRINTDHPEDVVNLLSTIYQMQEVRMLEEDSSVSVRAAQPVVDASEALLRELGYLAKPTNPSEGS